METETIKIVLGIANLLALVGLCWGMERRLARVEIVLAAHVKDHPEFSISEDGEKLSVTNGKAAKIFTKVENA